MKRNIALIMMVAMLLLIVQGIAMAQDGASKDTSTSNPQPWVQPPPFVPLGEGGCLFDSASPEVAIPDDGYDGTLGSMACQSFDFSSANVGPVEGVEVTIGATHTWIGDLTIKVQSPDATVVTLLDRPQGDATSNPTGDDGTGCCGDSSNMSGAAPNTFSMGAGTDAETMGATLDTAGIVCNDDATCAYLPNADSAAAGDLDTFIGETAAGVWTICISDSAGLDTGTYDNVSISVACQAAPTDVSLTGFGGDSATSSFLPTAALLLLAVAGMSALIVRRKSEA